MLLVLLESYEQSGGGNALYGLVCRDERDDDVESDSRELSHDDGADPSLDGPTRRHVFLKQDKLNSTLSSMAGT